MEKRLILTGAQGTGKSTILNHFKEQGYPVITEIVRQLSQEGVNINEAGDSESQTIIFNKYKELLDQESYISDRGLSDVVAYTFYLGLQGKLEKEFADEQFMEAVKFYKENEDIIICYVPIEFPVVDDGVRSMDEDFRNTIDFLIRSFLDCNEIPYYIIKGTVDERIAQVELILNEKRES
jgi:predicted ATPase